MHLEKSLAVTLLNKMGFKSVTAKLTNKLLQERLKKLSEMSEEELAQCPADSQDLLQDVLVEFKSGRGVQVEEDDKEESVAETKTKKPKTEKTTKAKKPKVEEPRAEENEVAEENPEKPAKKSRAEKEDKKAVDFLGSRVGTKASTMNAAIGKKPATVKEIMEVVGLSGIKGHNAVWCHLRKLTQDGKVVKEDGKYALADGISKPRSR